MSRTFFWSFQSFFSTDSACNSSFMVGDPIPESGWSLRRKLEAAHHQIIYEENP
jgi:hypothetical protein